MLNAELFLQNFYTVIVFPDTHPQSIYGIGYRQSPKGRNVLEGPAKERHCEKSKLSHLAWFGILGRTAIPVPFFRRKQWSNLIPFLVSQFISLQHIEHFLFIYFIKKVVKHMLSATSNFQTLPSTTANTAKSISFCEQF